MLRPQGGNMDLIGTLASNFGIENEQAQALAGGVLGMVKDQVAEKVGSGEAAEFATAIPELGDWAAKAQNAAPAGGDNLLGSLVGGLMGGDDNGLGNLVGMLGQMNLGADQAAPVGNTMMDFLKERLSQALLQMIAEKVPMIGMLMGNQAGNGAGGDAAAEMLGNVVGSLFGGDK